MRETSTAKWNGLQDFCGNPGAKKAFAGLMASGRMPHALCVLGEAGTGKKTFAAILAAAMVCAAPDRATRPCGECSHCRKAAGGFHPDITLITGGGGERSFHIDSIRQIRHSAYLKPNEAECKVYILADAGQMTVQAQNALLKLIEEPPDNTALILTCHSEKALLDTIVSRVAVIRLAPPTPAQCTAWLQKNSPPLHKADWEKTAARAGGNIGVALGLLEDEDAGELMDLADNIYRSLARGDEFEALALFAPLEKDRDRYIALLYRLRTLAVEDAGAPARGQKGQLHPAKAVRAAEQFLSSAAMAGQNVSLSLISAGLSGSIMEIA